MKTVITEMVLWLAGLYATVIVLVLAFVSWLFMVIVKHILRPIANGLMAFSVHNIDELDRYFQRRLGYLRMLIE